MGYLGKSTEKAMAAHSSTLAWKIPWTEEPGGLQSMGSLRVRHAWVTSFSLSCTGEGNGNPLQSVLAWRIPWTEEPGGLQFVGSQRVGHDWVANTHTHTHTHTHAQLLLFWSRWMKKFILNAKVFNLILYLLSVQPYMVLKGVFKVRWRFVIQNFWYM